ncbi:DUF885 domain-containing protein [Actinopolymorpha sp. B11F2]|uniref:DUF885 domain-containing protein n=1 Tax=Actinopolymorpha sp. B11F2 TaxID=3160862 RepID=UPI0032E38791
MGDTQADVAVQELDRLAEEMFRGQLAWSPLYASQVGYPGYSGLLPDLTMAGEERRRIELERLHQQASAVAADLLDADRRITREVMLRTISDALVGLAAAAPDYTVTPLPHTGSAATVMISLPKSTLRTAQDADGYLARCAKVSAWLAAAQGRLDNGRAAGRLPVRRLVLAAVEQVEAYLATSLADDPLTKVAAPAEGEPPGFRDRVAAVVAEQVRPALADYRHHLVGEVLPTSRSDEEPGLAHLPDGVALYQQLAAGHTTTDHSVDELHELGLSLVADLTEEMRERGSRTLGTADFAEITHRLRTDPELCFDNAEEMLAEARATLARAQEALPRWLGRVPEVGCEVLEQSVYEAENGNLGYYQWPSIDGARPGRFWLNTYKPATRPRFELQGLTFHESVPGHHTQLALLWELPDLCDFRRHARATAFTEGWALYTERLADEMGLYTGDVAKLGMVSFDFWRACRLVVDTGMHARGWSRDRAVRFMMEHSALTRKNVENEIDRYIAWPGQALGYMVGRLEIVRLRAEAEQRLGASFDIRAFHDALLGHGNLPLTVLGRVAGEFAASHGPGSA